MVPVRWSLFAVVLLAGCAGSGKGDAGAAPVAFAVPTELRGANTEGVRVLLRDVGKGEYVAVVHRASSRGGRVDLTIWVEGEPIEVLRGEVVRPWEMVEVAVELPGTPEMVTGRGGQRLVVVRGEEKLAIAAVVETGVRVVPTTGAATRGVEEDGVK